ncbi:MAG: serine racemase VanT catalytic subunit [Lachnospiraceae bacterium]|nr:serine racemase VanT catalytic subunit [Lachnospiraceae bacterium]
METKQNYGILDNFRVAAALLVIAIHTSPLMSFSVDADFFLTRILARIAVPFFLMVTGQFVMSDYLFNKKGRNCSSKKLWSYIKKTAIFYGISIAIYIPVGIYAGHYKDMTGAAVVRELLFDGTFYHLWYFPACIMGVLLVYLMSTFMSLQSIMILSGVLYVIGLFGDSYYGLIKNVPVISGIYEFGFQIFSYTRNGIFFAPVFLVLGAMISRKEAPKKNAVYGGLVLSFLLITAEAFTLRYFDLQRHDSMYIALIPVMIFLYEILLQGKKRSSAFLRNLTTWIYILHPIMIIVVRGVGKALHLTVILVDNSLIHYIAVTGLSVLAALLITYFNGRRRSRPGGNDPSRDRAWIEIDRNALKKNVEALRKELPAQCRLMPAIKADAYGHGADLIARELNQMGVDAFCVACVAEGVRLRRKGIKGEILVLGYTHPDQFYLLYHYHLRQTVIDFSYALKLNSYGKKLHVHIGIDTGMHRLGERSENIDLICKMYQMKNLKIDGLFTHLCAADSFEEKKQEFTNFQADEFYRVIHELEKRGYPVPKLHLQSSYGVLNYPELTEDYARVGIALYGVLSTQEDTEEWKDSLEPVLALKARVASVRDLYVGETAGYGMQFTADRHMKIAALTIGYADGYPRSLSNGVGVVLINGCAASVIGRICMDQTIVDVSGIPGVKSGDVAVLIGRSGEMEISVCDLAVKAGTITNEILSRMGTRLERVVV